MTDNVLISPFFIRVEAVITGHAIIDSFLFKLKTNGVLQVAVSDEDACNRNYNLSNLPSLIPSTYCHYVHNLLILLQRFTFS